MPGKFGGIPNSLSINPKESIRRKSDDSGFEAYIGVENIVAGTNITVDNTNPSAPVISATGVGSGGHTIQDEGVSLTQRSKLNFVGNRVSATDDSMNNATVVTINSTGDMFKSDNLSGLTDYSIARTNLGLGNVDNTSDLNKPISTATQTALNSKADVGSITTSGLTQSSGKLLGRSSAGTGAIEEIILGTNLSFSGNTLNATGGGSGGHTIQDEGVSLTQRSNLNFVGSGVTATDDSMNNATVVTINITGDMFKSDNLSGLTDYSVARTNLGLGNVDNTSDVNKPISNATQTALNSKEDLANKSTNVDTDKTSNTKYPSVKSVYDWATGLFAKLAGDITQSFGALTIELGNASDTTISRVSPGKIAVEGVNVGTEGILQNSQSGDYTTVLSDAGKHIYHPSADTTARTFTIDSNANVPYPIGTAITFVNDTSAGTITIAINSDTLVLAGAGTTGNRTLRANGIATAIKVANTRWIINGTGLS